MKRRYGRAFTYLAFKLGWLSCGVGAGRGWPLAGPMLTGVLVALHLWRHPAPAAEARTLGIVALLGLLLDSVWGLLGVLRFLPSFLPAPIAPAWIGCLWLLLAASVEPLCGWLRGRVAAAAVLGGLGGPLSYIAGERLGALAIGEARAWSLLILAVAWAALVPALVALAPSTRVVR